MKINKKADQKTRFLCRLSDQLFYLAPHLSESVAPYKFHLLLIFQSDHRLREMVTMLR